MANFARKFDVAEKSKAYIGMSAEQIQDIVDQIPADCDRKARVLITAICVSHEALRRQLTIVETTSPRVGGEGR